MGALILIFSLGNQVRIQNFLDKTKRKSASTKDLDKESDSPTEQQDKLRKKVTNLMKKQRLHQVRSIVKEHDHGKPWGQEAQVKVCTYGVFFCQHYHYNFP